jgi:hypothetical protein
MSRIKLFVGVSIAAAIVLSTSVALAKPLSEQQWRKQANSVCKQANKDLDAIGNETFAGLGENEEPSAEQQAAFAAQFVPVIEEALTAIGALKEPNALKDDVKKFESAVSETIAAIEADPSLLVGNTDPFAKVDKIARRIGLKACG